MCPELTGVQTLGETSLAVEVLLGFERFAWLYCAVASSHFQAGSQVPCGEEGKKMGLHCGCLQVLP